VISVDLNH